MELTEVIKIKCILFECLYIYIYMRVCIRHWILAKPFPLALYDFFLRGSVL